MSAPTTQPQSRQSRQQARQREITEAVMAEGAIRIEQIADRFNISVMTAHRDLDELEGRGAAQGPRGGHGDVDGAGRIQRRLPVEPAARREGGAGPRRAGVHRARPGHHPGRFHDHAAPGAALHAKTPLTVITNTLTIMEQLKGTRGITLLSVGGQFYNWCSAFMGRMAVEAFASLRADVLVMSTSAITDDIAFHQTLETVDVKRAMFESASTRILLADHTKFDRRALHAMLPLSDFDAVVVDAETDRAHVDRLRKRGVKVVVAKKAPREARS
ncbi:DeoR/GlpR family DNA-binding transcription regulator [Microbacterium elymi]|uniref:DeoR/GlpR family DNA-binding transcription regulator n=1 Tax=Microbacterium elymi TaxID=2909587 RepID=A0ABY5NLF5_9MICO|nr:DeoR/GlpR family DNA-binding transcription regulator [Microbacterium elymi]UUT36018.1 DeoR/GlpR family DNA-binding transcription regulator [Microbacterium elymi]